MPERFTVSDAHVEVFSQQQRERFEDEMVVHLRKEFAALLDRRDDAWLRELIQGGIEQAAGYDIVLERDVARYLEFMLALSPDFDDSPRAPWAKDILTDEWITPGEKLDQILEFIMFGQEDEEADQASAPEAPQPFNVAAVRQADEKFRGQHPALDPRRLTMEYHDEEYRRAWMAFYHEALYGMNIPPVTSRPHARVGDPVDDPSTSGELVITLVDAETQEPVPEASVQLSGPVIERAVASSLGTVRFEGIAMGEYDILAVDREQRLGQGRVTVKAGRTHAALSCARVGQGVICG